MPIFETIGLAPNFVDYEAAWQTQREVHAAVAAGQKPETVLLLEHSSVFTAGKRTEDYEKPTDGTPVINVDRGGKITWHGPGQLVGYPIMRLPEPIDVVGYVRWLEQVLIDTIAEFGVIGQRVGGRSGVWVDVNGEFEKVAAIGIRVAEKTTMHGFALNCDNSLQPYDTIVACGISDARTTTLEILTGKKITPAMAAEVVKKHLGQIGTAR
ncbi:MAG: lipoyl(octanoyl) transferase LipB [Actinobacteria bacterium]|uniref:lipoyl(octanoyl) transferase n=1 Tax=freshwater metagenome TaxID=449393 RepID=A0A6J6NY43_9ZZZZ|nr:lipoyl(octanoyl) transferase LipB [Actinomycetota bacterium]